MQMGIQRENKSDPLISSACWENPWVGDNCLNVLRCERPNRACHNPISISHRVPEAIATLHTRARGPG